MRYTLPAPRFCRIRSTFFSGEVIDEYDETNDLFSISIDPPEEINGINNIDYVTTYTKTDTNFNTVTYLLGKEMIRDGWDENKFSKMPYSSWYSINNAPISVFEEGGIDYTGAYGCYLHYYQIPVLLNKEDESSPIPLIGF